MALSFFICNFVNVKIMNDMKETNNYYCVILAGGKGRRLWPTSREQHPKQFIDFFGSGQTQLQQTYERFAKILPKENIFVNTNINYLNLVKEQLPQVADDHIMAEPIHRNTAPSAAWATHRIRHINPTASIIFSPSDQTVMNEEAFKQNVIEGLQFVEENDCLLTMGVKPTRPEPGYGYIQLGERAANDVYKVQSFTEKPDRELLPTVLRKLDTENPSFSIEDEDNYVKENFPSYPNMSIDHGILEKSENVYVMKCDFGWADLGTWHSIYEAMQKGDGDNVVIDSDVILDNSHGNVIKLPEGRMAVINGLDGYIVAEKDNVLLICKKEDSSALVKKFVNEVQMKKGEKFV